jgi:hypothetical protein
MSDRPITMTLVHDVVTATLVYDPLGGIDPFAFRSDDGFVFKSDEDFMFKGETP